MTDQAEALAKQRFLVINLVRISGVIFVMLGIAIVEQAIELPKMVGYVLAVIGLFDIFLFPTVLARRWKSGGR